MKVYRVGFALVGFLGSTVWLWLEVQSYMDRFDERDGWTMAWGMLLGWPVIAVATVLGYFAGVMVERLVRNGKHR